MSERVPPSLKEVWDWKARTEERTRGMDRARLIEFYRERADAFEKALGLNLPREKSGREGRRR
ncbi:MAG: hypothetical protein DCC65_12970 [Planctomycetota bacterium]|nr:MAG: hypothetical protein DCC65_12970 [Planctomycetota bacterium]